MIAACVAYQRGGVPALKPWTETKLVWYTPFIHGMRGVASSHWWISVKDTVGPR